MFWWNYVVFVVFFRFAADLVGRAFRAARWLRSKQSPSCCAINFLWIWLAEGLIESLSWAEQAYGLILLSSVLRVRRWWCDPVLFCVMLFNRIKTDWIFKKFCFRFRYWIGISAKNASVGLPIRRGHPTIVNYFIDYFDDKYCNDVFVSIVQFNCFELFQNKYKNEIFSFFQLLFN